MLRMKYDYTDYSNEQIEQAIDSWIHSERNREILKRRLIDDIFFEPLAEEFDLSVQRVKKIVSDGNAIVFSHIKEK